MKLFQAAVLAVFILFTRPGFGAGQVNWTGALLDQKTGAVNNYLKNPDRLVNKFTGKDDRKLVKKIIQASPRNKVAGFKKGKDGLYKTSFNGIEIYFDLKMAQEGVLGINKTVIRMNEIKNIKQFIFVMERTLGAKINYTYDSGIVDLLVPKKHASLSKEQWALIIGTALIGGGLYPKKG